ncbi:unnamed protein product [Mycena citricolor]|uniref:Histone acetyltransferase GCN5 n=1 Tax=Mycena citricolor TaxID=2018698 RepID=A0AAD2HW00_9AGAR|nr:unnamed protein product [Mycena citricolor]
MHSHGILDIITVSPTTYEPLGSQIMKYSYPASHDKDELNDQLLALKISRHSPCTLCNSCPGLHPDPTYHIVLDDSSVEPSLVDLDQYGSDDEDGDGHPPYLTSCACGHDMYDHGANQPQLGRDEFLRRGRVAIRLDELLQDVHKLLDFEYVDSDILSLRNQMKLPISGMSLAHSNGSPEIRSPSPPSSVFSALSDISPPPTKRRRLSSSSLSVSDEEEDRPLASRVGLKTGGTNGKSVRPAASRSGKKGPGIKTKRQDAPWPVNGQANGTVVKREEPMNEEQLSRLTTGVSVDSKQTSLGDSSVKPEKAVVGELRRGVITIVPVENDRKPHSLIILTGLKTLFQKQLPKMPREYIARLVYDSNSKAVAIVKRGLKVVGGICYRPFPHRGFAEIVFFATNSSDQVKGYGAMLMDHFKAHIKTAFPGMMHFLTYADNYAVGYFEKQGFSKEITLDRSVWAGYIKDYEGGTIMQCTMVKKVDYLNKPALLAAQQEAVMSKIREMSRSHIVYPGLPQFQSHATGEVTVDYRDVPGLRETGWTPTMSSNPVKIISRNADVWWMQKMLHDLKDNSASWAFQYPVDAKDVVDYYDVITDPMGMARVPISFSTDNLRSRYHVQETGPK